MQQFDPAQFPFLKTNNPICEGDRIRAKHLAKGPFDGNAGIVYIGDIQSIHRLGHYVTSFDLKQDNGVVIRLNPTEVYINRLEEMQKMQKNVPLLK